MAHTGKFTFASHFVDYQQKVLNSLTFAAVARHNIQKTKAGNFEITSPGVVALSCFYFTLINSIVKFVYLVYLLYDQHETIEFVDKMAAVMDILCTGIVTFGLRIWWRRYSLFEIFYRLWNVETSIFQRLGCPEKLKAKVDNQHKMTVWIHALIVWIGCFCFLVQFYADPKYCAFTYAVIPYEHWILWIIFGAHEFIFMLHPWHLMTVSNSLFTFQSIVLSNMIKAMTVEIDRLQSGQRWKTVNVLRKRPSSSCNSASLYTNVDLVLSDYRNLMVLTGFYNEWVAYKAVFLHMCGYCQFIADVFLAVQVLKLPNTGILDIWFYVEDSLASLYMIYRVYNAMSRVHQASENFFRTWKQFLITYRNSNRRQLVRVVSTLKPIAVKLGAGPVTRTTVLSAVEILGNYYICVALWQ